MPDLTALSPTLWAFALASLVLAVTPGPGVVYVVTRTLAQGRRAGLLSVAGVAAGNLGNALGAAIGLAAVLAASSTAFFVVKLAGAAYLAWLGIQALRRPPPPISPASPLPEPRAVFRDGLLVALLNPKTALFFAAFLPQFIDAGSASASRAAGLGAAFVLIAATTDTAWVLLAASAGPALRRARRGAAAGRLATALVYFGLSAFTAVGSHRAAR